MEFHPKIWIGYFGWRTYAQSDHEIVLRMNDHVGHGQGVRFERAHLRLPGYEIDHAARVAQHYLAATAATRRDGHVLHRREKW
jgi:hypothetical protein